MIFILLILSVAMKQKYTNHDKKLLEKVSELLCPKLCILTLLLLASCLPQGVKLNIPDCPATSQNCYPEKYEGMGLYDTMNVDMDGYKYKLELVEGINSSDNEWHLSFVKDNHAVMTYSEDGINRCINVVRRAEHSFVYDKGINGLPDSHIGLLAIKGDKVFFSAASFENKNILKNIDGKVFATTDEITGKSELYVADYLNNQISNINVIKDTLLKFDGWSAHTTISNDGNLLVFASDRAGGHGGTDLWMVFIDKNIKFPRFYNLGSNINSECDELSPFFSNDGKRLYFASSGNATVGGYDIFYSEIDAAFYELIDGNIEDEELNKFFSKPVNLGSPINSKYDEIFPSSPGNPDDILYFSSFRNDLSNVLPEKQGGFDLYVVHKVHVDKHEEGISESGLEKSVRTPTDSITVKNDVIVSGFVYDKNTGSPVDSALINVISNKSHKSKDYFSDDYGRFEVPVKRNVEVEIMAHKNEYFFDSKRIFFDDTFVRDSSRIDFYLPEIGVIRINFPTDKYSTPYKFTLDSNGVVTGRYWLDELKMVASNIKLSLDKIDKIVLVGHTDDVGSDDYNINLSQRRVDFVINELIKLGVPQNVLFSRAAGEHEPLMRHSDESTETFRKRLRRVTMEKYFK